MDKDRMNKDERQAMMQAMMAEFFGGMGADEKKAMCATMMAKMTEGLDMKQMMPKMMMGMMAGGGSGGMPDMMAKMKSGGPEGKMSKMPEMMLTQMMPHCIGMMLPAIEPDRRGEAAAAILAAVVDAGATGMSDAQAAAFRKTLADVLNPQADRRWLTRPTGDLESLKAAPPGRATFFASRHEGRGPTPNTQETREPP